MKNKNYEQKLNEVLDKLNATEVERTSILHSYKLNHSTFNDISEITPENVQAKIEHFAVRS